MKKILLAILLMLPLPTAALALTLDLVYSNVNGSGTYGQLQLTNVAGGVQVSANYNDAVFDPIVGVFGVADVYLNLDYTGTVTLVPIHERSASWSLQYGDSNGYQADGFGKFTLNATGGNAAGSRIPITPMDEYPYFTPLFTLSATGLEVSDFFYSADTNLLTAIHLAGYSVPSIASSEYLTTPVPGAVYLFGSGLVGLVGIARWRRRR